MAADRAGSGEVLVMMGSGGGEKAVSTIARSLPDLWQAPCQTRNSMRSTAGLCPAICRAAG